MVHRCQDAVGEEYYGNEGLMERIILVCFFWLVTIEMLSLAGAEYAQIYCSVQSLAETIVGDTILKDSRYAYRAEPFKMVGQCVAESAQGEDRP